MATSVQPAAPSTALTVTEKKFIAIRHMVEDRRVMEQIQSALPSVGVTPERFARIALTSIRRTPDLLDASPASIVGAIIQSAQLGLEPDGALGHAYLIPYKGECQFQVGYRGYIALARRSGEIKSFYAQVVHEGEYFEYEYGSDMYLRHRPNDEHELQPITHVYAVVHYVNGGFDFQVMSFNKVERIRATSKCPNSPAWKQHWEEMAKKTVIRNLAKRVPMTAGSEALMRAAALDEMADAGVSQNNEKLIDSNEIARAATQQMTENLSHKYAARTNPREQEEDAWPELENPSPAPEPQPEAPAPGPQETAAPIDIEQAVETLVRQEQQPSASRRPQPPRRTPQPSEHGLPGVFAND